MAEPEKLLDLVSRLDKYRSDEMADALDAPMTNCGLMNEWPRLSRAIREMHAHIEDHEFCPPCRDILARLDQEPGE